MYSLASRLTPSGQVALETILYLLENELWLLFTPCHDCLSIRSNIDEDLSYLRLESQIKHTVSLIKDDVRHPISFQNAILHQVVQSSGSSDDDLNSFRAKVYLLTAITTTVDAHADKKYSFS